MLEHISMGQSTLQGKYSDKGEPPFQPSSCHVQYVLIIQASVESSPKMIQLNIQIKIQFLVVIQRAGQNLCACQRNLQSYQ